ncbi:MAG: YfiR family protein [Candidatus Riflebacteria bacterium]|nr:YfiR family protein [Candidatus Riflebacteria bacterium]
MPNYIIKFTVSLKHTFLSKGYYFACIISLLLFLEAPFRAECIEKYPEYQVKAEMLIKFPEFVDWPDSIFSSSEDPFIIAIAGKDPFGSYLKNLARKGKIKGHKIEIRFIEEGSSLPACHILFIARTDESQFMHLLALIDEKPILAVSDIESFADRGAHITFQVMRDRVRFSINQRSAIKHHLIITSQLLRLASNIIDDEE